MYSIKQIIYKLNQFECQQFHEYECNNNYKLTSSEILSFRLQFIQFIQGLDKLGVKITSRLLHNFFSFEWFGKVNSSLVKKNDIQNQLLNCDFLDFIKDRDFYLLMVMVRVYRNFELNIEVENHLMARVLRQYKIRLSVKHIIKNILKLIGNSFVKSVLWIYLAYNGYRIITGVKGIKIIKIPS